MARYRKKPVVIEAVKYGGNGNMEPRGGPPDWLWVAGAGWWTMAETTDSVFTTRTHDARIDVVGVAPANQPYLRIEDASGNYLGTVDGDDLVALRDAITKAVRHR